MAVRYPKLWRWNTHRRVWRWYTLRYGGVSPMSLGHLTSWNRRRWKCLKSLIFWKVKKTLIWNLPCGTSGCQDRILYSYFQMFLIFPWQNNLKWQQNGVNKFKKLKSLKSFKSRWSGILHLGGIAIQSTFGRASRASPEPPRAWADLPYLLWVSYSRPELIITLRKLP